MSDINNDTTKEESQSLFKTSAATTEGSEEPNPSTPNPTTDQSKEIKEEKIPTVEPQPTKSVEVVPVDIEEDNVIERSTPVTLLNEIVTSLTSVEDGPRGESRRAPIGFLIYYWFIGLVYIGIAAFFMILSLFPGGLDDFTIGLIYLSLVLPFHFSIKNFNNKKLILFDLMVFLFGITIHLTSLSRFFVFIPVQALDIDVTECPYRFSEVTGYGCSLQNYHLQNQTFHGECWRVWNELCIFRYPVCSQVKYLKKYCDSFERHGEILPWVG